MIRYAPIIADTIPAFIKFTEDGQDKIAIKIPFTHNPAVDWNEVIGFSLIIKDITTSQKVINEISIEKEDNIIPNEIEITFDLTEDLTKILIEGNYYKLQLAYYYEIVNEKEEIENKTSPYSSVSIGRYIGSAPEFSIANSNIEIYQGEYSHDLEALYQYRYDFYENNNLVQTSDWIFYKSGEILKPFTLLRDLEINNDYKIKFSIITINGYEETKKYEIVNENFPLIYDIELKVSQDHIALENGYMELEVIFDPDEKSYGTYEILRKPVSSKVWEYFLDFDYTENIQNKKHIWKDFTVSPGIEYVYGIRLKEGNKITEKILSDSFTPQFDSIFLSDGEKQLCIRFNPKVSNFKTTIAEQKINTIGNKFPIFFKNPVQNYKEFSISGLISYHMDNENFFMDLEDKVNYEYGTTNLTNDNFSLEKLFKLQVLDWLNNGNPKLFRSPAEGSYIVRLTDVSLSPNEQLGNMIHTFQASASECMEMTQQNLKDNDLIFNNKIIELNEEGAEFNSITIGPDKLFVELNNISDIQYSNNTPVGLCTLTVDNKNFKVYDYYKFPEDVVYTSLQIDETNMAMAIGATITYKQHLYKKVEDEGVQSPSYWKKLEDSENKVETYNTEGIICDWLKYYTIIFTNTTDNILVIQPSLGNEIKLLPNETKKFYEISGKYTFTIPPGVTAYAYGRKIKEEQINE